ncbi:hypothetical protein JCM10212_004163 [Sporobolomyces blumeae]
MTSEASVDPKDIPGYVEAMRKVDAAAFVPGRVPPYFKRLIDLGVLELLPEGGHGQRPGAWSDRLLWTDPTDPTEFQHNERVRALALQEAGPSRTVAEAGAQTDAQGDECCSSNAKNASRRKRTVGEKGTDGVEADEEGIANDGGESRATSTLREPIVGGGRVVSQRADDDATLEEGRGGGEGGSTELEEGGRGFSSDDEEEVQVALVGRRRTDSLSTLASPGTQDEHELEETERFNPTSDEVDTIDSKPTTDRARRPGPRGTVQTRQSPPDLSDTSPCRRSARLAVGPTTDPAPTSLARSGRPHRESPRMVPVIEVPGPNDSPRRRAKRQKTIEAAEATAHGRGNVQATRPALLARDTPMDGAGEGQDVSIAKGVKLAATEPSTGETRARSASTPGQDLGTVVKKRRHGETQEGESPRDGAVALATTSAKTGSGEHLRTTVPSNIARAVADPLGDGEISPEPGRRTGEPESSSSKAPDGSLDSPPIGIARSAREDAQREDPATLAFRSKLSLEGDVLEGCFRVIVYDDAEALVCARLRETPSPSPPTKPTPSRLARRTKVEPLSSLLEATTSKPIHPLSMVRSSGSARQLATSTSSSKGKGGQAPSKRGPYTSYWFPLPDSTRMESIEQVEIEIYGRKVRTPARSSGDEGLTSANVRRRGSETAPKVWVLEADEARCRWSKF